MQIKCQRLDIKMLFFLEQFTIKLFRILFVFSRDSDLTTTNVSSLVSQSVSQQIVKSSLNR